MNALRSRKEENEKTSSRAFERKWFQKMRSSSSASSGSGPPTSQQLYENSSSSLEHPSSDSSGQIPGSPPSESFSKSASSKLGSRLVPRQTSKPKPLRSPPRHSRKWGSTSQLNNSTNSQFPHLSGSHMNKLQETPPKQRTGNSALSPRHVSEGTPSNNGDATIVGPDSTPRGWLDPNSYSPSRSRSNSSNSAVSQKSSNSANLDSVSSKLGKLFFWERTSSTSSSNSSHSRNRSSGGSLPPPLPDSKNTVPFPSKANSDVPRVVIDPPENRRRRRKTEESGTRSRSSSLALSFGRSGRSGSGSHSSGINPHRPTTRRSTSSDDVRLRRVLPLPPPPTIGLGNVLDDPHVKALGLDPMAVRYADHMHMLGYTRNRYVCALLSHESSKEGSKYNGMVMQAFVMRMLRFQGEPLDMSLRKFLFRIALPQEAQQIERLLQNFSVLWNYQNPGVFSDDDQVLYVVFSLVMLHTDAYNKNVKHKISKADYVRNAAVDGIAPEIFEYFYDNITAAPFRPDDDVGPVSPQSPSTSQANSVSGSQSPMPAQHSGSVGSAGTGGTHSDQFFGNIPAPAVGLPSDLISEDSNGIESLPLHNVDPSEDSGSFSSRRSSSFTWMRDQPMDPYPFLLENRLDALRPELTSISAKSPFTTWEVENQYDLHKIQQQLGTNSAVLHLISQRSRPDAYITGHSEDVLEAQSRPGIVEVQIIKHGIVLRREVRRMALGGHKPGWREWGVVLTSSRLYLTKNVNWLRQLNDKSNISVDMLQSASVLSTRDMAALIRCDGGNTNSRRSSNHVHSSTLSYLNHGNHSHGRGDDNLHHFMLVEGGRDSTQQCFAVHNEDELKDWVQTINTVSTQISLNVNLYPMSPLEKIRAAMNEVDEQLEAIQTDITGYQKTLKHFKLLAPLHQRTREALVFTAGRYSSKCDDAFAELARLQAYRNVLELAKDASSSELITQQNTLNANITNETDIEDINGGEKILNDSNGEAL